MALLDLPGHIFIIPGDITQLRADVVVYSASTGLGTNGRLYRPFAERFDWFTEAYRRAVPLARPGGVGCAVGHAFRLEPPGGQGPAVVVVASTIDGSLLPTGAG